MAGVPAADCPHRPPCPGCPRFGEPGIAPAARRVLEAICADAGLPTPVVVEGNPLGFRHRARLAVRGRTATPKIGIFAEGSHRIVDVPRCLVHHPMVNAVAAALKDVMRRTGTTAYVDRTHRGLVRYLQVVVERPTGRAQVVVVANAETPASLDPLAAALAERLGNGLHSLWWNGNPIRTNVILGPHWHRWSGPEAVCESIGGTRVFFPPGAFGQANLPLADRLVARVAGWVPDGASVVEFHAGCGAIGLGLVPRVARIAFNEASPAALAGLALGLDAMEPRHRALAEVLPGSAASFVEYVRESDVVIVDPPRQGVEPVLLRALADTPPRRLVTVSCNLDAFVREATVLRQAGRLVLREAEAYALFPFTTHVETLALWERRSA